MILPRSINRRAPQRLSGLFLLAALSLSFAACEAPDDLGKDIITLPGEKFNVAYSDTTSVIGHSVIEDSIRTEGTVRSMLGSMVDPVFGTTSASIYTQLRLSTNNVNFGDNPVLDSVVLWLSYQGEYAQNPISKWDKLTRINVYELSEKMDVDSTYYSSDEIAYDPTSIGETTFIPLPSDSITVDSVLLPPMFRVPLSHSFGQKILNGSGTVYLSDNSNFIDYVKGLHIKATNLNNLGSLSYINLLSSYSRVVLYYHNDEDTLSQVFIINENCSRFTHFDHYSYAGARSDLRDQVSNGGDTTLGVNSLFIQPMAGIRTKIHFPYLQNWVKDGMIAISRAELIIKPNKGESSFSAYTPPATLALVKIREDGSSAFLTDYLEEGSESFGGTYDTDKEEYHFNITWHIQELLDGRSVDNGLWLAVSGNAVNANRLIIGGHGSDDRIKLLLTYVEL